MHWEVHEYKLEEASHVDRVVLCCGIAVADQCWASCHACCHGLTHVNWFLPSNAGGIFSLAKGGL
jgi:hypothetical protein